MDLHRATQVGIEPAGDKDTKAESQPVAMHSENAAAPGAGEPPTVTESAKDDQPNKQGQ
jgi:hypothetical protein